MELRILIGLVVGLYRLIEFIVKMLWRLLRLLFTPVLRSFGVGQQSAGAGAPVERAMIAGAHAPPKVAPRVDDSAQRARLARLLGEAADAARSEANEARSDLALDSIVPALDALAERADRARALTKASELQHALQFVDGMLAILRTLLGERRAPALRELLIGADALAGACYRPIVEYCRSYDIPLSSNRVATAIGGDKLFFLGLDEPTGLATVVLPEPWARELVWWPALAHEMAHDFYNSVDGLGAELKTRLGLHGKAEIPRSVGEPGDFVTDCVTAWQEELFADAFGTLMMGPSYVRTMAAIFGAPKNPVETCTIDTRSGRPREARWGEDGRDGPPFYDEHPPGHVRVLCGCALLTEMGYGALADGIEAVWRRRHGDPTKLLLPTQDGDQLAINPAPMVARAAAVGYAAYRTPLDVLRGVPLRSIPGLDFGPREVEESKRIALALNARRPVEPRDPRLVVAGAISALVMDASDPVALVAQARILLGQLPHVAPLDEPHKVTATVDGDAWRDAIVLGALLERRGGRTSRRQPL